MMQWNSVQASATGEVGEKFYFPSGECLNIANERRLQFL